MTKSFKLDGLECANCASQMERDISKIDGVDVSISFMTARMRLSVDDGIDMEGVLDRAQDIVSGYEPDCVIVR